MDEVNRTLFAEEEKRGLYRAIYERRDVRAQFLPDPIPLDVLARVLDAAHHAPSVGFMQPWDFIVIQDLNIRRAIHRNFEDANREAASIYTDDRRESYRRMKLAGILDAPINICVTCDHDRATGHGLGRQTDPATDVYSTVCAVQNLWLAARAESLGVGWVSILDLPSVKTILKIPERISLVAYLCIGYVSEFRESPDLEQNGWERRLPLSELIHFENWTGRDEARALSMVSAAVQP